MRRQSKWRTIGTAGLLLIIASLSACSNEYAKSVGESIGQYFNESQRDKAIRNAQSRISDDARCARFKEQLLTEGQRYESAASGAFQSEPSKITRAAEAAGCLNGQKDQDQPRSRAVIYAVIYKSGDAEGALEAGEGPKEAAWNAFYKPSPECLKTVSVECGNEYLRARKEFERKYEAGKL